MQNVTQILLFTAAAGILAATNAFSDDGIGKPPDFGKLVQAGGQTSLRLEQQAASWTATTYLSNSTKVIVTIRSTPKMRRTVINVYASNRKLSETTVISRDGLWYVSENGKRAKYRPYEAPFALSTTYLYLLRAEPRFVSAETPDSLGIYEGAKDGIATFRMPLSETIRKQAEYVIQGLEKVAQQNPKQASNPESIKTLEQMRGMLQGTALRIDIATGMIVQLGAVDRQTEITGFKWSDDIRTNEFAIEKQKWEDFSDDPTLGNRADLVMIRNDASWQPGMKAGEANGCLMDVQTGRFRRIPFQGITSMSGCFLLDRSRVVVTGADESSGAISPYEINLSTGENRRLGSDELAGGNTLFLVLSPDGKTVAALHKKPDGPALDSQIFLIDLASGNEKPLGKPHDMAFVSWLPNGKGLISLKRESPDPLNLNVPRKDTIVRMGLDGQTTHLLDGGMPVVLADGKTILFKPSGDQGWQTCDLDGKNIRLFADGMAHHTFPAPAPDGQRILWMNYIKGAAPVPTIIDIGKSAGTPVTKAPGLWTLPAWR